MKPEDALSHCQAYLDGQLDAATAAEVAACLAANPDVAEIFEEERKFHAFIKARSARIAAPANLIAGIKSRLAEVPSRNQVAPAPLALPSRWLSRRGFLAIAASVAIMASAVGYQFLHTPECPYMVSCADEHADIVCGKCPTLITSQNRSELAQFVDKKLSLKLNEVPALDAFKFSAASAGISTFENLKKAGSPDAAFVSYKSASGETATLFIHPWEQGEPMAFNKTEVHGHSYWAAKHGQKAVASWKSDDGKLLLSVVTERTKTDTLEIAEEARRAFSTQKSTTAGLFGERANDVAALQEN